MRTKKRLLKVYNNRRLYDFWLCCYITYDNVRELVRKRVPFKIVDTSGQDVTLRVMGQVLANNLAKKKSPGLLAVITSLVRRTSHG